MHHSRTAASRILSVPELRLFDTARHDLLKRTDRRRSLSARRLRAG